MIEFKALWRFGPDLWHLSAQSAQEKLQKTMVTVAQLVESRIVIPVVVGSSPIGHPIIDLQLLP